MFGGRVYQSIAVVAFFAILLFPSLGYSQSESALRILHVVHSELRDNGVVPTELFAFGQRGDLIADARLRALAILEENNSCTAWFQQADPDPAGILRSVHYTVDLSGPSNIYVFRNYSGEALLKHPWGATSVEYAGRNAFVRINGNGPFFVRASRVEGLSLLAGPTPLSSWHTLVIGPYPAATPEARIAMLLHELGHIVGRLPADTDSCDGQSSRNTIEVLRHCKAQIHLVARRSQPSAN